LVHLNTYQALIAESIEIKEFIREQLFRPIIINFDLFNQVTKYFPMEYSEVLDELPDEIIY
jgi:hypothetical protein